MGMSDPSRQFLTRTKLNKQKVMGFVVANDDTQSKDGKPLQRVKIRIPFLDRNVEDKDLPWVTQQMAAGGSGNGGDGMSSVQVPAVGSKLWVHFEDEDDPHTRFYSGYAPTEEVVGDNELNKMDYPHTYGGVDQMGNMSAINTTENTKNTTHVSGQVDATDGSGERTIYSPTNINIVADGSVNIAAKGGINIHGAGVTSIKGSRIKLNSGDSKKKPAKVDKRKRPKPATQTGRTTR